MAKRKSRPDEGLDELYREHPGGFVAGRDRLAREARDAGDRDGADRLKGLRRPTTAAWLVNRAALSSPAEAREFAEASRVLDRAQRRALEGKGGGAALREAAAREREATEALVAAADRHAREAGHPASDRALELAGETLRAASADPDLRELVLAGRLERERSAATLGTAGAGPPPKRAPAPTRRRGDPEARRELRRLERRLADATAREDRLASRVERAADALREERRLLAETKREAADLRRRAKAAERRARG